MPVQGTFSNVLTLSNWILKFRKVSNCQLFRSCQHGQAQAAWSLFPLLEVFVTLWKLANGLFSTQLAIPSIWVNQQVLICPIDQNWWVCWSSYFFQHREQKKTSILQISLMKQEKKPQNSGLMSACMHSVAWKNGHWTSQALMRFGCFVPKKKKSILIKKWVAFCACLLLNFFFWKYKIYL